MGQELNCRMHYRKRVLEGKAYLETDYILFRGTVANPHTGALMHALGTLG